MKMADGMTRRDVMKAMGASALVAAAAGENAAGQSFVPRTSDGYKRADASWLGACKFGISSHWTALSKTVDADGWLPFEETVNRFSPEKYVDQIAGAGAQYVIFTGAHAMQILPAPCEAIDRLLPGRTTKRDLIGEIADACRTRGLHFILYYNHSCNDGQDAEWEYAVGYHAKDKRVLVKNLTAILSELGARYGERAAAWWFDSCYAMDGRGLYSNVSTDFGGFEFPWEEWTAAAKTGFEGRLVALNPGVMFHYLYTTHQDYEAGEANQMIAVPTTQDTAEGLQSHRWVCLDNAGWVHQKVMTPLGSPRYTEKQVTDYVRECNRVKVPVTFNVDIDRPGTISPKSLELLRAVRKNLG